MAKTLNLFVLLSLQVHCLFIKHLNVFSLFESFWEKHMYIILIDCTISPPQLDCFGRLDCFYMIKTFKSYFDRGYLEIMIKIDGIRGFYIGTLQHVRKL